MLTLPTKRQPRSALAEVTETASDVVGQAWSSGSQLARELASTAAQRATELGSVAAEQVGETSEKVVDVVTKARDRARPVEKRRWNPWVLLAVAVAAVAATGWWMRQRRQDDAPDTLGDRPSPVADYRAAAGD